MYPVYYIPLDLGMQYIARSLLWFVIASALVGTFGFVTAHALNVGDGLGLVPTGDGGIESIPMDYQAFITNTDGSHAQSPSG